MTVFAQPNCRLLAAQRGRISIILLLQAHHEGGVDVNQSRQGLSNVQMRNQRMAEFDLDQGSASFEA